MQKDIKKLYYAIGEVSELTGLEPHVLRYWESEFAVLKPKKNRAGRRIYTEDDIAVLQRIQHLLREEKYTIEGARQALELEQAEPEAATQLREQLLALRAFLVKLRDQL
jgi:DNA-binding transcriptional MerR regulator